MYQNKKNLNKSKNDIVTMAYRQIVERGIFDVKEGNRPIRMDEPLNKITKRMYDHVEGFGKEKRGKGCCFVFSAYMMEILKQHGIECWMIATKEGNGTRASVLYEDKGELFVANPVEDIEFFTQNGIKEFRRGEFYIPNTPIFESYDKKFHDDSRIPLQEFANRYGTVKVIGNLATENIELYQALSRKENKILAYPIETCQQDSEYSIGIYDLSKLSLLSRISSDDLKNGEYELGEIINKWLKLIEER